MDSCFLKVLHHGADEHIAAVARRIHVEFRGLTEVFVDQQRTIWCEEGLCEVGVELLVVAEDLHAAPPEHVRRTNQHWEADGLHRGPNVVRRGPCCPSRHAQPLTSSKGLEALPVARFIDGIAGGPHDGHVGSTLCEQGAARFQRQREVDRRLTPKLEEDAVCLLPQHDFSNVLRDQRFEIQAVGGVEIGGHRFWIVVDQHCVFSSSPDGVHGMHTPIVELNALTDADGATADGHDPLFRP